MENNQMLPVGATLHAGTYRIERLLASGGFGNTYVVTHTAFGETLAMKEFFMRDFNVRSGQVVTVSVPDKKATFENQKEKLKKEALRLRALSCKHLVRVHDLFEENGTVYYVMDLIEGESLSDRMRRLNRPLTEAEALNLFSQMLEALDFIHAQQPQLFHLDIKPSNIMVDHQGNAFLIDFGSSKQLDADNGITVSSGVTLTKGYAPQELEDGKKERIGAWTDLYELGATLYNLLTRQSPPTPSELAEDGTDAFFFPSSVSQPTRDLIAWMMTLSRRNRPQCVADVRRRMTQETTSADGVFHSNNMGNDETIINEQPKRAVQDREETTFGGATPPPVSPHPVENDTDTGTSPMLKIALGLVGGLIIIIALASTVRGCGGSSLDPAAAEDTLAYPEEVVDSLEWATAEPYVVHFDSDGDAYYYDDEGYMIYGYPDAADSIAVE